MAAEKRGSKRLGRTTGSAMCGFADVFLYIECKHGEEVKKFNRDVGDVYPQMKIQVKVWSKKRKLKRSSLQSNSNFVAGYGRLTYLESFTMGRWEELPHAEKLLHSTINCLRCREYPAFGLKSKNRKFVKDFVPHASEKTFLESTGNAAVQGYSLESKLFDMPSKTPTNCANCANSVTPKPQKATRKPRPKITIDDVPRSVKRQIVKDAQDEQRRRGKVRELSSLMTTGLSFNKWNKNRATKYGIYKKKNKPKCHVGSLKHYVFDRNLTACYFREIAGGTFELDDKMRGKWASMARRFEVKTVAGKPASQFNGGQVMQAFAQSLGYTFKQNRKQRLSWYKHDIGISGYVSNNGKDLSSLRDELIADGTIDIGTAVAPITTTMQRYDPKQKKIVEKSLTVYGRKISLRKIRERHLRIMSEKGFLRTTDVFGMEFNGLRSILDKHQVNVDESASIEDLRQQVTELETTRHIVLWQDHSDIGGHSHYLVAVWFLYDEAVFMTKEEIGFDIQGIVEQPFLYIIGRSKASVSDQLLYIPERAADLEHSRVPILFNGRYYYDKVRFNSGDLPARQFESGQALGGDYPCHCGVEGKAFKSLDEMLQIAPFYSLAERTEVVKQTFMTQEGIDITNMKKEDIERQLIYMGISMEKNQKVDALKELLKAELKGIRRLPVVCHSGLSLKDLNCEDYEVSWCDPLHDLKNLIQQILEQLPGCMGSSELQMEVSNFCTGVIGEKRTFKGTDARLHLINFTLLMEEDRFQANGQCRDIYEMLSALCEIQRLAYQLASERSSKNVLRFHLQSLIFSVKFFEIFKTSVEGKKKRGIFSTPFHCVTTHMAEMYRLVSLRSIVTETSERMFSTLKGIVKATNHQPDNVLNNIIVRTHFMTESNISKGGDAFGKQQKKIERTQINIGAENISKRPQTFLSNSFITENKAAVLCTFRRIADFLLFGPGIWYNVNGDGITFTDGPQDISFQNSPVLDHFRSSTLSDVQKNLEECWNFCKANANSLQLDVINEMAAFNTQLEFAKVRVAEQNTENASTDLSGEMREDRENDLHCKQRDILSATDEDFEKLLTADESTMLKLWEDNGFQKHILLEFFDQRQQVECRHKDSESYMSYVSYRKSFDKVFPFLEQIEQKFQTAVELKERQFYAKNKQLSAECVDRNLREPLRICRHYQVRL